MFTERTVALLDISKLILILEEELAAMLTHCYGDVWHHVFVESTRFAGAQMGVVYDKYFLVSHVLKDVFVYFHRLASIWVHLVFKLLEHLLGEEVVFHFILIVVKLKSLLITMIMLLPAITSESTFLFGSCFLNTMIRRIHFKALYNSFVWN
jgi:hypothetical protein